MVKYIFIFSIALSFLSGVTLQAQTEICNQSENTINKVNQFLSFPCSNKRGAEYAEVNYKYCATFIDDKIQIVINDIIYSEDVPCNNNIPIKILFSIFSNKYIQETLQLTNGGEYNNIIVYFPDLNKTVKSEPAPLMKSKNCLISSAVDNSEFLEFDATLIMRESCEEDIKQLSVVKASLKMLDKEKKGL